MSFGTPVINSAHGNSLTSPYAPSVAAVVAGRIIVVQAYVTQGASVTPADMVLTDTSAAPLTWTPVFATQPVSNIIATRTKAQWWWAVSDGAAKTLSLAAAGSISAIGATIFDFSIGAGMNPDFTNQASAQATTGTSTTTDPVCTLPTLPGATDLGLCHKIGQGGGTLSAISGWTSLSRTVVNTRATDCAYDTSSPAQSVTWTNSGYPNALITMAALTEKAPPTGGGGGGIIAPRSVGPFDFPASPTVGQTYSLNSVTYVWDGQAWMGGPIVASDSFVRKAGDTMTGVLTLAVDPTNALDAATKQYVDARSSVWAHRSGAGAVSLGASTYVKANMGTLGVNIGGWSISGGSLVVPKTGTYLISSNIDVQTPATANIAIVVGFSINNSGNHQASVRTYHTVANNVTYGMAVSQIRNLIAGQTIELLGWASVTGCSMLDPADGTFLCATLLSS